MPIDFLEPALNSIYLFGGIVGFLGSFIGWLYSLQRKARTDDKAELIEYVDNKFKTVCEQIQDTKKSTNEKLDHSNNLLTKILQYETRNIKLHIRNLNITDQRLEADISRIESIVLFKTKGQDPDRSLSYPREKHKNSKNPDEDYQNDDEEDDDIMSMRGDK